LAKGSRRAARRLARTITRELVTTEAALYRDEAESGVIPGGHHRLATGSPRAAPASPEPPGGDAHDWINEVEEMSISDDGRLSPDGAFPNGVKATAVARFVADYDGTARIEDVADYLALRVEDVCAALDCCSRHFERLKAAGELDR
jgi:hypothetical protein